ncbi:hypothetical protein HYU13_00215 [Candidatus Woesearchaeota archaeon]|nr:hypothetical protein [Candidatus Woesearchaeota archaeon]
MKMKVLLRRSINVYKGLMKLRFYGRRRRRRRRFEGYEGLVKMKVEGDEVV